MPINSAIYNPFTGTNGRLGGINTLQPTSYQGTSPYGQNIMSGQGNGNIFGDVARNATSTPTGEGAALGYGADGDTPEFKDNAWKRFVNTLSPYLSAGQLAWLNNQRGSYESAAADAQARDPGYHFADVLGNADVVRGIQGASPFSLGGSSRYIPTRFR
jgi:hypothetical protein